MSIVTECECSEEVIFFLFLECSAIENSNQKSVHLKKKILGSLQCCRWQNSVPLCFFGDPSHQSVSILLMSPKHLDVMWKHF